MVIRLVFLLFLVSMFFGCAKKKQNIHQNSMYRLALLELESLGYTEHGYKRCLKVVEQGLIEQPDHALLLALKGTCLFKLKKFILAEKAFLQARKFSLDSTLTAEILNNYACLLAVLARYAEAIVIWDELITSKDYLTPEVALVNKGRACMLLNNYRLAITSFEKAITLSPDFVDAYYCLALAFQRLNNIEKMQKALQMVLNLEPLHYGAQALLNEITSSIPVIAV